MTKHSSTSSASQKSIRNVKVCALAGVVDGDGLKLDGDLIIGQWKQDTITTSGGTIRRVLAFRNRISRSAPIVETFLNWGTRSEEVLRFVRTYGPLTKIDERSGAGAFKQSIQDWRDHQHDLQHRWRQGSADTFAAGMKDGEQLHFSETELRITVESLRRFLEFEIYLYPSAFRRICAHPHCKHPYFIAARITQQFCSPECAEWAQRKHKQAWWAKHGDEWRKEAKHRKTKRRRR